MNKSRNLNLNTKIWTTVRKIWKKALHSNLLAPDPAYNIFLFLKFLGRKNKIWTLFKTWFKKKIDTCLPWIQKKELSINVSNLFFWKYQHSKRLTVKNLHHQRCQKDVFSLHLLYKIHWWYVLSLLNQFFLCVLKAVLSDSVFLVVLHFSASFLCDAMKKLIVHLQHSLLTAQEF